MWTAFSAAPASSISPGKLMMIGWATPTVEPLAGTNLGGPNGAVPVNGVGSCAAAGPATTGTASGSGAGGNPGVHRRPATVAQSRRCEHLVMIGEKRDYVLPRIARHGCTVQQHQGRLVRAHEEVWHRRRAANRVSPMKAEPSTPIACLR